MMMTFASSFRKGASTERDEKTESSRNDTLEDEQQGAKYTTKAENRKVPSHSSMLTSQSSERQGHNKWPGLSLSDSTKSITANKTYTSGFPTHRVLKPAVRERLKRDNSEDLPLNSLSQKTISKVNFPTIKLKIGQTDLLHSDYPL